MIKNVVRDSAIYGVASIFSRGLAFLILPIYTRVLSPEDFGAFDMVTTFGALANLVVALEVSQGLARYWPECGSVDEKKNMASSAWWFSVFMYSLFFVFSLAFYAEINRLLLKDSRYEPVLQVGVFYISLNGLFGLLQNQFRWELRSRDYAFVSLLYSGLIIGVGSFFSYGLGLGLMGVMWGQAVAVFISVLMAWWLLRHSIKCVLDFSKIRMMLVFSMPLVPSAIASFVSLYLNRLALNSMASLSDVGLFSLGNRMASIASLFIVGIQGALTPLVYTHHQDSQTPKNLARLFDWFVAFALWGCLGLGMFSREIVSFFAPKTYIAGADLVIFLAPAILLTQMYIFAPGIAIKKKTHWQLGVMILTAAISAGLNFILVPFFGGLGAAIATLGSSIVFFCGWFFCSQKLYPVPFRWRPILMATMAFVSCVVISWFIGGAGFSFWCVVATKLILQIVVLPAAIVAAGLISKMDISKSWIWLRNRCAI